MPIVSTSTTKRSDVDHTVTCKYTTSAFPSYKHSLEGDTAANSFIHQATCYTTHSRPSASEMTYIVSSGALNSTHSLTPFPSHWG